MHNKVGSLVMLALIVVGIMFGMQVVEWSRVKTTLAGTLSPQNTHMFRDSQRLEQDLWDQLLFVPEDAGLTLELYHYNQVVSRDALDGAQLPSYGGVENMGNNVRISALVAQVSWTQSFMGQQPRTTVVRRAVLVDPGKVGYGYASPPRDWDLYDDPGLLLRAARL
jgi:hypothetical protein